MILSGRTASSPKAIVPSYQDVELISEAWRLGADCVSTASAPGVSCTIFVEGADEEAWVEGQLQAATTLQKKAWENGANAILRFELTMDPHAVSASGKKGLLIHAFGVPAILRSVR